MIKTKNNSPDIQYFHGYDADAAKHFSTAIYNCIYDKKHEFEEIVILCIGTDRATGDCLGPLVGSSLSKHKFRNKNIKVYGNLENPVHAKNLIEKVEAIYATNSNPLVIAIDAALGKSNEYVGYLTVGAGAIRPGAAVNKDLPTIGDIFVTGIVNFGGSNDDMGIIQNTRLHTVVQMAEVINLSMIEGVTKFVNESQGALENSAV